MEQSTATVVAAVLAFVGVLAGLAVGLRRSHRERRDVRTLEFTKERQAAYRNLWSTVEGLSVALRTETLTGDALHGRIRDINAELLRSGLYIDELDRHLATAYIKSVEHFHDIVSSSDDPDVKISFGDTDTIPPHVIQRVRELGDAQERATGLRDRLIRRIRDVLTVE
jgi:hypothetical protein